VESGAGTAKSRIGDLRHRKERTERRRNRRRAAAGLAVPAAGAAAWAAKGLRSRKK
jgi:hypothetical protein